MKAVRLLEYGGQLVFNDVPTPAIARDEILVKIKSSAVNHLDLVKASGTARQILPIDLPWIPGHEFSGVVEQVGSDVAEYAPGDAVFAANETGARTRSIWLSSRWPSQGNHPTSPLRRQHLCRCLPNCVAGTLHPRSRGKGTNDPDPWWCRRCGRLRGAIASHAGATVIATASGDDEAYLNSIGASRVIDYREAQFEKALRENVDVVFDLIGGDAQSGRSSS